VKWSPNGDKFAVGTGAKCVPVCHFEDKQNWWISKMIKKHKSSVIDLDWSPNQRLLVTGGCDFKCRIFSAFIEGIDQQCGPDLFGMDKETVFGECLMELDQCAGWVQGVAFSPSGTRVAFSGHGSTLSFAHFQPGSAPAVQTIHQKCLPTHKVFFSDENSVVALGFDFNPTVYGFSGSDSSPSWSEKKKLDPEKGAAKQAGGNAARSIFQDADSRGIKGGGAVQVASAEINTIHKNVILDFKRGKGNTFTTSGVDGRIVTWTI